MPEPGNIVRDKRVLLADDEPALLEVIQEMLAIDGHKVLTASNGAEALELFTKDKFDLVITDFEMPAMKGSELAVGIKLTSPETPILMITSYDRGISSAENPVDAILDKPFTLDDLRAAILTVVSRNGRNT